MNTETIRDSEQYFYTPNLKVATALVTLGFLPKMPCPITRTVRSDGRESTVFWLDAVNAKGQRAEDVFTGMTKGGEALNESDPENPINYIRAALANRDVLVDWIRNTPRRIEVEIKGRRLLVREDATDADKKEIIQNL
jgi:hypothetical protein